MSITLDPAVQAFFDTTNAGDSAGFVAAFTEDAYLNDWGREFHGREGAASWNVTDNIGKQAHFEVHGVRPGDGPGHYFVTATVSGNGYNGTGDFDFTVRDGLVARMVIVQ